MVGESWPTVYLESIAATDKRAFAMGPFGSNIKSENYTQTGVPVLRGVNFTANGFSDIDLVFLSAEKAEELSASQAYPGDLVFVAQGSVGKVGLVPDEPRFQKTVLSQNLMKFACDRTKADPHFLYYFFISDEGQSTILSRVNSTGVPCISRPLSSLKLFEVRVPPLSDQQAIAGVLSALDDKIESNRQMSIKLARLAQAIFRTWFVDYEPVKAKAGGATSFPSMPQAVFDALPTRFVDSEIGPVPEGWQVEPLSNICTLVSGGTPKRTEPSYWGGDVAWYSVKDAPGYGEIWVVNTDERITQGGLDNSAARIVPKGCTIISARGTVGKLAMAGMPMTFNQSCYGLLPNYGTTFSYLYLLVETTVVALQQRTHGSVFNTITRATFDGLMVISPQREVVTEFETVASPVFDLLLELRWESVKLSKLRDYLLPRLLRGSVRVEAANG